MGAGVERKYTAGLKSNSVSYPVPNTNCEFKISNSFYFLRSYIDTVHDNVAHSRNFLNLHNHPVGEVLEGDTPPCYPCCMMCALLDRGTYTWNQ